MLIAARANYQKARASEGPNLGFATAAIGLITGRNRTGAARDLVAANDVYSSRLGDIRDLDAAIAAAGKPSAPKIDMSFDDDKEKKKRQKKDRSAKITADFENDLGQSAADLLRAKAELEGGYRAAYTADIAAIEQERASYARTLQANDDLTDARRSLLLAAKDAELSVRREIAEQTKFRGEAQESYDLAKAENDAAQDRIRVQIDAADSVADRRAGELRLLDLQRRQEEADLDLVIATEAQTSAAWDNARADKARLGEKYAAKADAVARQNEGPASAYLRSVNRSSAAIAEDVEKSGVDALRDLNTGLTDALMGTAKLADAFENMGKRIIASLIDIAIQQAIIKPLANSLFGAADASGNRSGGSLAGVGTFLARTFGGGKATGGPIDPSSWYVVGEKGPELFAPGVSGTVIPNGGRGSGPRQQATVVQLMMDEGGLFAPRVQSISGSVSVQTVKSAGRSQAFRNRQTVR